METKQLEVVRTSFRKIDKFPDPAEINTAGKWYLLNHISSPLIEFDHKSSTFKPLVADTWDIDGSTYTFHINPEAKFSDGSHIKATDVAQTIRRILVKKTSTHFPLWNHVKGCENLSKMEDDCTGLIADDKLSILKIELKTKSDSFLLQISSPETGIWATSDISLDASLIPTKYSGPYSLLNLQINDKKQFTLSRNAYSLLQKDFPNSPKTILIKSEERSDIEKEVASGNADIFIGDFIPYNEYDWEKMNLGVHLTTPSSILYFFGLNSKHVIGQDLLDKLDSIPDSRVQRAKTFLPFSPEVALTKKDLDQLLPQKTSPYLKVAAPGFYFKPQTLEFIKKAAKDIGIELEITPVERAEFFELFTSKDDYKSKYDFLLSTYVASERNPAVQLRFITGSRIQKVDLSDIESPDQDPVKINRIKDFQRWLLKSQTVVPVYFVRSHIISSPKIDVGEQPTTDAEIQLWRLTRK